MDEKEWIGETLRLEYERGRREGSACVSCKGAAAVTCSACNGNLEDALLAQGRREGYAESLRWVDHYLTMPGLHEPAHAALWEVRKRIAHEMEYGKLTTVAMGEHVGAAKGGDREG